VHRSRSHIRRAARDSIAGGGDDRDSFGTSRRWPARPPPRDGGGEDERPTLHRHHSRVDDRVAPGKSEERSVRPLPGRRFSWSVSDVEKASAGAADPSMTDVAAGSRGDRLSPEPLERPIPGGARQTRESSRPGHCRLGHPCRCPAGPGPRIARSKIRGVFGSPPFFWRCSPLVAGAGRPGARVPWRDARPSGRRAIEVGRARPDRAAASPHRPPSRRVPRAPGRPAPAAHRHHRPIATSSPVLARLSR